MAFKTLTISQEAHQRLKKHKLPGKMRASGHQPCTDCFTFQPGALPRHNCGEGGSQMCDLKHNFAEQEANWLKAAS
jgi:hypothetical protein